MLSWIKITALIGFFCLNTDLLTAQDQAAAKAFGLSLLQSYFDDNCAYVADHLAPTIYSIEGGQTIAVTDQLRQAFCKDQPLRTDVPVSFELYLKNYAPCLYNRATLQKAHPKWAAQLSLQKGDWLFDGSQPKAAGHQRLFKSEGQARFILRPQGDDWVVIGL